MVHLDSRLLQCKFACLSFHVVLTTIASFCCHYCCCSIPDKNTIFLSFSFRLSFLIDMLLLLLPFSPSFHPTATISSHNSFYVSSTGIPINFPINLPINYTLPAAPTQAALIVMHHITLTRALLFSPTINIHNPIFFC